MNADDDERLTQAFTHQRAQSYCLRSEISTTARDPWRGAIHGHESLGCSSRIMSGRQNFVQRRKLLSSRKRQSAIREPLSGHDALRNSGSMADVFTTVHRPLSTEDTVGPAIYF